MNLGNMLAVHSTAGFNMEFKDMTTRERVQSDMFGSVLVLQFVFNSEVVSPHDTVPPHQTNQFTC